MKTSKILLSAAAAIMAVAAASCSKTVEKADGLSFKKIEQEQTFRLENSAKDYEVDADLLFSCEARLLMPETVFGHNVDTLQNTILKLAFDTVCPSHDRTVADAFRAAAAEIGYTPVDTVVPADVYDGCLIVEGDVATLSSEVMAYAVTVSTYRPFAAHGMYTTFYVNYDLADGRLFDLKDLVTAEGIEKLPATLKATARSMKSFIGPTQLTALPADGNFYIDIRGNLVFVYQPYEIASYAQGIIEIPVPAYQLADDLTAYGRALLLDEK